MQQGYITLSASQAGGGGVSLLAHQANPVIQGTPLTLPQISGQFQEVAAAGPTNMVQLTPVCYGNTGTTSPAVVDHSTILQSNLVG